MFVQLLIISRDWLLECTQCGLGSAPRRSCVQWVSIGWVEVLSLLMMALLLLAGPSMLFYVLTVLMGMLAARELLLMAGSMKRYFCSPENWMEVRSHHSQLS